VQCILAEVGDRNFKMAEFLLDFNEKDVREACLKLNIVGFRLRSQSPKKAYVDG